MGPYLKIVAAMLIWSTWGIVIRRLDLPPAVVLFYTSLIASITVPLALRLRGGLDLGGIRNAWPWFAALALTSVINNITFFYALGATTVSNAVFTHYTAPLFVALLAPILIAERLRRITLVSLPIAAAGMVLIIGASGGLQIGGEHAGGIAAGTVSGIALALLIIFSRKLSQMLLHDKAVFIIQWITAALTAPAALLQPHTLTVGMIGLFLVTGVVHSTIAPLLYYSALRNVIAQHAAILGYIEPLAAVPLAVLFLSEVPSVSAIAGGLLIIISGYLVIHDAVGRSSMPG